MRQSDGCYQEVIATDDVSLTLKAVANAGVFMSCVEIEMKIF